VKKITTPSPSVSELLDARTVRETLKIDRSTVYRMAEDGRLPAIKVGRQWRFPAVAFQQWLQGQGLLQATPPLPCTPVASLPGPPALSDLLPLTSVQLIQDTFAETIGAMAIITDMAGRPVTRISNPCGLFAALADVPDLMELCVTHWQRMAGTIDLEPRYTEGSLGLLCARGLIRAGAELKGMVFMGGFAPELWPPSPARLAEMAGELRVPVERLTPHLGQVYRLEAAERDRTLNLIQRVANIVSHLISERAELLAGQSEGSHNEESCRPGGRHSRHSHRQQAEPAAAAR
jgi:excisionase family DNA binding protein